MLFTNINVQRNYILLSLSRKNIFHTNYLVVHRVYLYPGDYPEVIIKVEFLNKNEDKKNSEILMCNCRGSIILQTLISQTYDFMKTVIVLHKIISKSKLWIIMEIF